MFRKVAERNNYVRCVCGSIPERILEAPTVHAEVSLFIPFKSPKTGKIISTREAHRADLRSTNSIPWEPGIKDQIKKKADSLQAAREAKIDATVDSLVREAVFKGDLDSAA